MTSQEYRQTRETMGLSQTKVALLLGVSQRTIQRRETNGKDNIKVTREAEIALCSLQAFHAFGKIFKVKSGSDKDR